MNDPEKVGENLPSTDMEFVFWRHLDENVEDVLPHLEDTDVILVETSPFTPKPQKLRAEALANFMLDAELTPRQTTILKRNYLEGEEPQYDPAIIQPFLPIASQFFNGITLGIVRKFHGSGKGIRFLDINSTDHPDAFAQTQEMFEREQELKEATLEGEIKSVASLLAAYDSFYDLKGENLAQRDEAIKLQIASLLEEMPDRKIAVVYGLNHTPISYPYLEQGASRTFISTSGSSGSLQAVKHIYNLDGQIDRSHRFGVDVSIMVSYRKLLKDALTVRLMTGNGNTVDVAQEVKRFDPAAMRATDIANDKAKDVSSEQVEEYVGLLDNYLASNTSDSLAKLQKFLSKLAVETINF